MPKRILAAIFVSNICAAFAIAQEAAPAPEFGRASGGQIEMITKQPSKLSGSFAITRSDSNLSSGLKGYEATLGGTIVEDRLWFFGTAQQQNGSRFATAAPVIQQRDLDRAAFAKSTAQLGDRHVLDASFGAGPSSFLSLRYQAAVSNNMFISATFSRDSTTHQQTIFDTLRQ
jgi:hypothetical protein